MSVIKGFGTFNYGSSQTIAWIVFVITLSLLLSIQMVWEAVLISFLLSVVYLRFIFIKRIGELGDTIGALIELLETNTLITFFGLLIFIFLKLEVVTCLNN